MKIKICYVGAQRLNLKFGLLVNSDGNQGWAHRYLVWRVRTVGRFQFCLVETNPEMGLIFGIRVRTRIPLLPPFFARPEESRPASRGP